MAEITLSRGAELLVSWQELGVRWKPIEPQGFRHWTGVGIYDIRGDEYFHPRYGFTVERCMGWQIILHFRYHQLRFDYI